MNQVLHNLLALVWQVPVAFALGWRDILRRRGRALLEFFGSIKGGWILLIVSTLTAICAALPWFDYQVQFEELETYGIRSELWTLFLLPGFLGILFPLIQFPRRKSIQLGTAVIVLLVWIAGLIWPHQIHVDFHPATSYQVTVFYWIYPGLLIGTILATLMLPPESGWNYSGVMERLQNEPDHPEN